MVMNMSVQKSDIFAGSPGGCFFRISGTLRTSKKKAQKKFSAPAKTRSDSLRWAQIQPIFHVDHVKLVGKKCQ
ncbi:MAG: hypothetical protein CM1200mP30_26940 [Pseudomonadota bacterium]|nr:MAG: hypothetical protein CM1200mP30_26940 [Pseudomonadota bacterium]